MSKTLALKGLHAVVTGGGRGIGASISDSLAMAGAKLTLMGRSEDTLKSKASEIGGDCFFTAVDVGSPESITAGFSKAQDKHGPVQILVNNAGAVESVPFAKADLDLWTRQIDVNLRGTFLCIKQVLPAMLEAGSGRIINIASTAGLTGYPYVGAYCAAKHGVVGLTKSLALEVASSGVTVNAVCPGFTETDLLSDSVGKVAGKTGRSAEEIRSKFLDTIPQRRFVLPTEVASAVAWLADPAQRSVTGQTIAIDGGELL